MVKSLRVLFDELYKAKAQGISAHNAAPPCHQTALFLHYAVQEMRVLNKFKTMEWGKHPKIITNLTEHLVETY